MTITPITQRAAKAYIKKHHRHHQPPVGSVFQISVTEGDLVLGVAMVGRPVSRHLDNGLTLEVNRMCTTGTKNVCSMLYGACWRVAKNLGYKKLITYILENEKGVSLKASGWKIIGESSGGSWNKKSRPREDNHPLQKKIKYGIE